MHRIRPSILLALTLLAGSAGMAFAAEPVTPQADRQAVLQQTLLPEELGQILTPEPLLMAPIERYAVGPCTATVTCRCSPTISCSSDAGGSCVWRPDYSPTYPGYVKCGSFTASCEIC